jgi:hypothetical protein
LATTWPDSHRTVFHVQNFELAHAVGVAAQEDVGGSVVVEITNAVHGPFQTNIA